MNGTKGKRSHHPVHEFRRFRGKDNCYLVRRFHNPSVGEPIFAAANDLLNYRVNGFDFDGELSLQTYWRLGMWTESRNDVRQDVR